MSALHFLAFLSGTGSMSGLLKAGLIFVVLESELGAKLFRYKEMKNFGVVSSTENKFYLPFQMFLLFIMKIVAS